MFPICSAEKVTFIHVYVQVAVYSVPSMCWQNEHVFLSSHLRNLLVGGSELPPSHGMLHTCVFIIKYLTLSCNCLHSTVLPGFVEDLVCLS